MATLVIIMHFKAIAHESRFKVGRATNWDLLVLALLTFYLSQHPPVLETCTTELCFSALNIIKSKYMSPPSVSG